jgi:BolA protein
MTGTRLDRLTDRLNRALEPEHLEVVDDSHRHAGHAGAADGRGHFTVLVTSPKFAGLGTLKRHRLIYEAVGDMMTTDIHALSIQAVAPGEAVTD